MRYLKLFNSKKERNDAITAGLLSVNSVTIWGIDAVSTGDGKVEYGVGNGAHQLDLGEEDNHIVYDDNDPVIEYILTCVYNVNTTDEILLYGDENCGVVYIPSNITEMIIDGIKLDETPNTYRFETPGEHTVIYKLSSPEIENRMFWPNNSLSISSIIIGDSITSIGRSAFESCFELTSITIPNSVTSIGDSTFSGCSGLTSITIPDSVTIIGDGAFSECSGLNSITIPNSVTSIGSGVFDYCSELTSINYEGTTTDWEAINKNDWNDSSSITTIHCSDGDITL